MPLGKAVVLWDGRAPEKADMDIALCKAVAETLEEHYPGYIFRTFCDSEQGYLSVQLPVIMGNWRYVCHLSSLKSDPKYAKIIKGIGEVLEEYEMPRAGVDHAALRAAFEKQPFTPRPAWDHNGKVYIPGRLANLVR